MGNSGLQRKFGGARVCRGSGSRCGLPHLQSKAMGYLALRVEDIGKARNGIANFHEGCIRAVGGADAEGSLRSNPSLRIAVHFFGPLFMRDVRSVGKSLDTGIFPHPGVGSG